MVLKCVIVVSIVLQFLPFLLCCDLLATFLELCEPSILVDVVIWYNLGFLQPFYTTRYQIPIWRPFLELCSPLYWLTQPFGTPKILLDHGLNRVQRSLTVLWVLSTCELDSQATFLMLVLYLKYPIIHNNLTKVTIWTVERGFF